MNQWTLHYITLRIGYCSFRFHGIKNRWSQKSARHLFRDYEIFAITQRVAVS